MTTEDQEKALWELITLLEDCIFYTAKGLKFSYKIKGGEMFITRKATVFMAYRRAVEMGECVTGPKKLGTFGASYLYPVFERIGVIRRW